MLADVSVQDNQETARMIEEVDGRALAVRCDVTRSEDVQAAALIQAVGASGRLKRWDLAERRTMSSRITVLVPMEVRFGRSA